MYFVFAFKLVQSFGMKNDKGVIIQFTWVEESHFGYYTFHSNEKDENFHFMQMVSIYALCYL